MALVLAARLQDGINNRRVLLHSLLIEKVDALGEVREVTFAAIEFDFHPQLFGEHRVVRSTPEPHSG